MAGLLSVVLLSGCASMDQASRTVVGSQVGSLAGGILGAVIGNNSNRWDGAELGAMLGSMAGGAVGAAVGASIGNNNTQVPYANNEVEIIIPHDAEAPRLDIEDIYLEDANNNQAIDAGESCRLTFILVNNGLRDALNVIPVITIDQGAQYLKLSEPVMIQYISADDKVSYSVRVKATSKLPDGQAKFTVYLQEQNGYDLAPQTFTVETRRLRK